MHRQREHTGAVSRESLRSVPNKLLQDVMFAKLSRNIHKQRNKLIYALRGNPRHIKSSGAPPKFQLRKPRLCADLDLERRHLTAVLHEPSLTGMQFSGDLMRP
ncbi:unnamed protein product [Vitrella brassicaformis CCMP3155]|uniref:Uncharacterized protein n=1 Tax=Vitrella brassicaformis (strain CCMP3155) TaxID=1169540 RepID=A0A0G4EDM9_VITBC|nr:unnamed protein product [Vitrella brassicaformis CCMP3155]|eukprot:CEL93630.1 unnamed protein product [Vitrella brassicaformis CCMP3155]